jgi:diadenosine tetraphosphate (Ap4A) HIT family hydrolase
MELFETEFWQVKLHPSQENLGKCVLIAKNKESSLAELSEAEWIDFGKVVRKLEISLKRTFHPTHFNYKCLMNDSFNPDGSQIHKPAVHWHFIPRYAGKVKFCGMDFSEPEYPQTHKDGRNVPDDVLIKIADKIRGNL